ncbi:MAG: EVE domain-containing protein [Cyclobacteriaceae bacterium]|nr:EVE domain-containing protein [Cyclobacteriaceae bacterium]MDW8332014.1 EVE domain-containing protein [Cyclobacteriaceae bacterium]
MNYWLVKTEPDTYAWDNLVKDKTTVWDGIRNFQARKFLKEMKKGDTVLVYHTGDDKSIQGIAKVTREAFPDPKDNEWLAVELAPVKSLKSPVPLSVIKNTKKLDKMMLVRSPRLSVQPVRADEFDVIIQLSEKL